MSFVMFAGCQYFGLMIGDRRSCTEDGKIIDENAVKVKRVNDNLIVSGAGNEDIIKLVFEYLDRHNHLAFDELISLLLTNYHLIYSRLIDLATKQHVTMDEINANIGIASIVNGLITFSSLHVKNEIIEEKQMSFDTSSDVTFCYLGTGLGSLGNDFQILFEKNPVFSISNIKSVFYSIIKSNIKNDFTINDRFVSEVVIRSDIYDEKRDRTK